MNSAAEPSTAVWHVIGLCAQWCGTCTQWRPTFDAAAARHPGLRFSWVDIEDEADVLGDIDVETFPTLLVAHGRQPRFFGPVLPQPAQLERLLSSLQADPQGGPAVPGEVQTLLDRLHEHVLHRR